MKIIQAKGQTCNQFWIYSHYFAESIVTGEKIFILAPDIEIRNYPNLSEQKFVSYPFYSEFLLKFIPNRRYTKFLNLVFANKFSIKILKIILNVFPNVEYIEGNMQDFTSQYWHGQSKSLKDIYRPIDSVTKKVNDFFRLKEARYDLIVGVHIRRGDYEYWQGGKFYYSNKQYLKVMQQVEKNLPGKKVGFLVCSNEIIDLSTFIKNNIFILKEGSAAIDLYSLSLCNYLIGPPSSFSAWASFYGGVPLYFIENCDKNISISDFTNVQFEWPPYSSKGYLT